MVDRPLSQSSALASITKFRALQAELIARHEAAQLGRRNPRANALLPAALAPTITISATIPTSWTTTGFPATSTSEADFTPYISSTPGWRFRVGNQGVYVCEATTTGPNTNYGSPATSKGVAPRYETNTEDPKPTLEINGSSNYVRLIVNDQYMDLTGFQPDAANGLGNRYVTLDFTQGGTVVPDKGARRIQIECQKSLVVGRVILSSPIYSAWSSPRGPIIGMLGDSWQEGLGVANVSDNLSRQLGDWLGTPDVLNNGIAGSGIATQSSGSNTQTYQQRINDLAYCNVSAAIITGLTNDIYSFNAGTLTRAAFQTAVQTFYPTLRAALPNVPIIALTGSVNGSTPLTAAVLEDDVATQIATMQAAGDTRIAHVRTLKPTVRGTKPWIFGSGSDSSAKGDGNMDVFGSSIAAGHLNALGYGHYAKRASKEIIDAIRQMT